MLILCAINRVETTVFFHVDVVTGDRIMIKGMVIMAQVDDDDDSRMGLAAFLVLTNSSKFR